MYDSSNYEINDTRLAPSFSITPDSTQAAVRIDRDTGEQARSSYGCLGEQARRSGVRHLRRFGPCALFYPYLWRRLFPKKKLDPFV